jgi:hypothetical protein
MSPAVFWRLCFHAAAWAITSGVIDPHFRRLHRPCTGKSGGAAWQSFARSSALEVLIMVYFRVFLALILVVLSGYTAIVISNHGMNLLPVFFGDIAKVGWPGQFNLDFLGFLSLSALWTAWRHHFSPFGLVLGVFAFFGGMGFLTIYLLVASFQVKGDVKALLLGPERASH